MNPPPCLDDSGDGGSSSSLRCTQCTAVFDDVLVLLSHLDSHASRCPICNKEFTSKQFLDHHMKSHPQSAAGNFEETPDANGTAKSANENAKAQEVEENLEDVEKIETEPNSFEEKGDGYEDKLSNVEAEGIAVEPENKDEKNETDNANEQGDGDERAEVLGDANLKENQPTAKEASPSQEEEKPKVAEDLDDNNSRTDNPVVKSNADTGNVKKPKIEKPYRCSKCKYTAMCVAIVNMHQRRQHPGEWTTVISTLDDTEVMQKNEEQPPQDEEAEEKAVGLNDGSEDEEVRKALQSPLPESDSEEEEKEKEYRCSMCDYTAKDTNTVFEHQQDQHPREWQLTLGVGSPDHKEGVVGVGGEDEMESSAVPVYELPTELDHFSSMGRSIIAGNLGSEEQAMDSTSTYVLDSRGYSAVTGKFHCCNCPAYFYDQGHIRRHMQTCRPIDAVSAASASHYRCRLCKRVFADMDTLLPHMINHQRNYPCYRCTACGYKGKFEGTIIAHIHRRHPQGPDASIEQIASREDITKITNWWDRVGPMRDARDELEVIGEAGIDDPDLQHLLGVATPNQSRDSTPQGSSPPESLPDIDTQSQCSEMSDEAAFDPSQWTMEAIASLKLDNNYVCPECPVLFREPYKLKRHLDTHAGVKRHICKICGKRFTRSEHLKRHRVVHANTKPYMCSICGYSSKRLDNLQKHQRVKHPGEACEIVRVSKEMIEAEIAANERAQSAMQLPAIPRPQLAVLPQPPQALVVPPTKAKRGRPRKISSPDDNFVFSRDPNYTAPTANFPTPTHLGNNINMTQQSSNGMHMNSVPGAGNLNFNPSGSNPVFNYSSMQPSTSFYQHPMFGSPNLSSMPMQMPGFDLSSISAAAAAAVIAPLMNNQNATEIDPNEKHVSNLAEKSSIASGSEANYHNAQPISNNVHSYEAESNKITMAALVNRGRYQCHVCDRPFSYLKPFKKHLLCHGTFMPYECSMCGHQSKRRDMMQDHQREAHHGMPCEIRVNEPTSDMHDMMDTYIQQVPDQRQNLPDSQALSAMSATMRAGSDVPSPRGRPRIPRQTQMFSSAAGGMITALDRSMVDPQVRLNLPLDLVKVEPLDPLPISVPIPAPTPTSQPETMPPDVLHEQSKPISSSPVVRTRSQFSRLSSDSPVSGVPKPVSTQSSAQNQNGKAVQKVTDAVVKSERTTSSPVIFSTFSPQTPTSGAGLVRPRPRRANLIKFKVLSPHTKAANKPPAPALVKPDGEETTDNPLVCLPKDEESLSTNLKEPSCTSIKHELVCLPKDEEPLSTTVKKPSCTSIKRELACLPKDEEPLSTTGKELSCTSMKCETLDVSDDNKVNEEMKKVEDDSIQDAPPIKRRRMSERRGSNQTIIPPSEVKKEPAITQVVERLMPVLRPQQATIGTAPKVPIMGLKPGKVLLGSPLVQKALVVDIKSHKGSPKDKQGDNHRFACSVCDQRFAYEKPFKRHLLVHGGFEPYRCNACGHHTTSRDSMKVHQHKTHLNQKGLGITVLDPTPEMEQSLIQQGLLHQQVEVASDDEENPANKSIVETARMEQHKMAAAMKTLSATVKKEKNQEGGKEEDEPSFPLMLGLRPANSNSTKDEDVSTIKEDAGDDTCHRLDKEDGASSTHDDISDLPVDDAIFDPNQVAGVMLDSRAGVTYPCQYCSKIFHCSSKLQRHLVSHTGIKAYECQICFKKLTRLEHLKRHLLTHGNLKPYRCSACKFDAKRLDIVQLHQQMAHAGEAVDIVYLFTPSVMVPDSDMCLEEGANDKGQHGCATCGLMFVTVNHLMAHQKTHNNQKPYECFICHKTFTRPEHLKRHRLVHDDTKPYRCSECGFKTKRLDGMREHQRSRHPTSTEVFIIDTILPEHPTVKRKRGRPPKFGPRDSLDGLQLLHCNKCCLAFYDQTRFEQHKIMHIPSPIKPQDLTCQICGIQVSQAKHLRRHMLLHENHTPYQCSLCGYTAKRTDHMQLHFRKQHPDGGARMIHIAKDGTSTDASTSYIPSDDSANDGSTSLGNESYFESYSVEDLTETSLTLEQLNEMAEVSEDEEEEMGQDYIGEQMNASEGMESSSLAPNDGQHGGDVGLDMDCANIKAASEGDRSEHVHASREDKTNSDKHPESVAESAEGASSGPGDETGYRNDATTTDAKNINLEGGDISMVTEIEDHCRDEETGKRAGKRLQDEEAAIVAENE